MMVFVLITTDIETKTIGAKPLFKNLRFTVENNEKMAIIGRNGVGKTTLFRLLTGEDTDFEGNISFQRGIRIASTAQEHHGLGEQSALAYILENLPDYTRLKQIIETYPETMGDDMRRIEAYSAALEHFSSLGYYTVETDVLLSLAAYQIDETKARAPMQRLSGGQKRFVELVRIEHSDAGIALIDEPTNHMDYAAKASFIEWLKAVKHAVVVITHDRDVLKHVGRIIEIKDGAAKSFNGNYDAYLKQNAVSTTTKMHDYEITARRIKNLKDSIVQFRRLKERARDPDTIKQFKRRENQATEELAELEQIEKPTFWIDRESAEGMKKQASEHYEKYKTRNIRLHKTEQKEGTRELLKIEALQLGYGEKPLFSPVDFRLQHGERLRLIGRNGAGKTTLVKAIVDAANGKRAGTWKAGSVFCDPKLRLSVYEQEAHPEILDMTLAGAIDQIHRDLGLPVSQEAAMRLMGDYLFNPHADGNLPVRSLSGGQKARLQIMKMLANNPNLLILDEPTNHLDLPSIEELENALQGYHGALLYVSHDSYFAKNVGGDTVTLA